MTRRTRWEMLSKARKRLVVLTGLLLAASLCLLVVSPFLDDGSGWVSPPADWGSDLGFGDDPFDPPPPSPPERHYVEGDGGLQAIFTRIGLVGVFASFIVFGAGWYFTADIDSDDA